MHAAVLRRLCQIQADRLADIARARRIAARPPRRPTRPTVQIPVELMAQLCGVAALALTLALSLGACGAAPDPVTAPPVTMPNDCDPTGAYQVTLAESSGAAANLPPAGTWTAAWQGSGLSGDLLELDGPDHAVLVFAVDYDCVGAASSSTGGGDGVRTAATTTALFHAAGFDAYVTGISTATGDYTGHLKGVR